MSIFGEDMEPTHGAHLFKAYSVSQKNPPWNFLAFFSKNGWECLVQILHAYYKFPYAGLQIFIQLPATLTKLCHIKHDNHNVPKMSTIVWNARCMVGAGCT